MGLKCIIPPGLEDQKLGIPFSGEKVQGKLASLFILLLCTMFSLSQTLLKC